jgi:hypothetical protein
MELYLQRSGKKENVAVPLPRVAALIIISERPGRIRI